METSRYLRLGILSVAIIYVLLSLGTAITKLPFNDEGWLASPGWNLITAGHMGTSALEPTGTWLKGVDKHTYWIMPLYPLNLAVWYEIFGFGIVAMRSLTTFWGLIGLLSWYVIVKSLFRDSLLALLSMALLAFDAHFLMLSAVARMDMMAASLGFAAIAAYLSLRKYDLPLAILASHTLAAMSVFTHPYGGMALIGLAFLYLYFDRERLKLSHPIMAVTPYLLGAGAWAAYISHDPDSFVSQFTGNAAAGGRFNALTAPWSAIREEVVKRYIDSFGFAAGASQLEHLRVVSLLAYVFGVLVSLGIPRLRQNRNYRAFLLLGGLYFVMMTLLEGKKSELYLVYILPFLVVVLSVAIHRVWADRILPRSLVASAVAGLLLLQFADVVHAMSKANYQSRYLPGVNFLRDHMRENTLIMGPSELGFELGFRKNLVDDFRLGFYSGKSADLIVIDQNYKDVIASFQKDTPEVYDHVQRLLKEDYRKVYGDSTFDIYQRNRTNTQGLTGTNRF